MFNIIEKKKHIKICGVLLLLITTGLSIRLFFLSHSMPLTGDALDYFAYSHSVSVTNTLPINWNLSNNGWPLLFSQIIKIFNLDSFENNILLFRIVGCIISSVTIFPMYLLCNLFFNKKISLIGGALLIFEPRIILNSSSGLIEPLYILIGILTLYFFLKNNQKLNYMSFVTAGVLSILRWEGIIIFPIMIILFILKNPKKKKFGVKPILMTLIFLLTIFPLSYLNYVNTGSDGLIMPILNYGPGYIERYIINKNIEDKNEVGIDEYLLNSDEKIIYESYVRGEISTNDFKKQFSEISKENNVVIILITNLFQNSFKLIGPVMIPTFIVYLPFSIFIIFKEKIYKKKNFNKWIIISMFLVFLLPALYAFSRNFNDVRYIFPVFPIFCLISLFVFDRFFVKKFILDKKFFCLILLTIILPSFIFLQSKQNNDIVEIEKYEIAKFLINEASGTNYSSITKYFKAASFETTWPNIQLTDDSGHIISLTKKFDLEGYDTFEEFLYKNRINGLTHITAEKTDSNLIINQIYNESEEYFYLEKVFDSTEKNMVSNVKIFKINYFKLDRK